MHAAASLQSVHKSADGQTSVLPKNPGTEGDGFLDIVRHTGSAAVMTVIEPAIEDTSRNYYTRSMTT